MTCHISSTYGELGPDDQEVFRMVLDDNEGYPSERASEALAALGSAVTPREVREHRAGTCSDEGVLA